MIKSKVLLIFVFMFCINNAANANNQNSFELSDLNIDVIVSIEGIPNVDLAYTKPIANTPKLDPSRFPNLRTSPVKAVHGTTLKLKIETVDKFGVKTDVTNDKNLKIVIAGESVAHICNKNNVCVWPEKPSEPRNYDPRYETAIVQVLYFTPKGKSIGINSFDIKAIPDPSGRSINPPLIDTKPKPSTLKTQPVTDQTWQQIKNLKGIATQSGMVTPSLYVFFDPNCPYCTDLWKTVLPVKSNTGAKPAEIQKAEFFNSLPAVWIPVAYINGTSLGKSAALLRENSHSAIDNNFQTAKRTDKQGGAVAVVPSEKEKSALAQAKALWLELGGATPLMVFRNKAGSTQLFMGVPSDDQLKELMNQVGASTLSAYPTK